MIDPMIMNPSITPTPILITLCSLNTRALHKTTKFNQISCDTIFSITIWNQLLTNGNKIQNVP